MLAATHRTKRNCRALAVRGLVVSKKENPIFVLAAAAVWLSLAAVAFGAVLNEKPLQAIVFFVGSLASSSIEGTLADNSSTDDFSKLIADSFKSLLLSSSTIRLE